MKRLLFAILITVTLPGIASAQMFNGMAQPTDVRFVQSYNFNTAGNNSGLTLMFRADPTKSTLLTAGSSYNHATQQLKLSLWQGVVLFNESLYVLHRANYVPDSFDKYQASVAGTLFLPGYKGSKTYEVNTQLFNYTAGMPTRYLFTAGARLTDRVPVNAGLTTVKGETGWVVNARVFVYKKTFLEYRYSDLTNAHKASLFIHF